MKKIGLFIDYANLLASIKRRNIEFLDFKELLNFLENEFSWNLIYKALYFAYPENETRNYDVSWIHKFWAFLKKKLWFSVVKKPLKQIEAKDKKWKNIFNEDGSFLVIEKWNLDIELTMDIMQKWENFDTIILFSWDSDFKCLTQFLLRNKKKVFIFSTFWNISYELKMHSTDYYDIDDLPIWIAKYKKRKL